MGRIKSIAIKILAEDLVKNHGKRFSGDFEKNKEILGEIKKIKSKRIRNILAGYITKKMKNVEKSGI
jgi:small subunit ribosomal protein S17e